MNGRPRVPPGGFTLIEMLIVMVLLAILLTMGYASLQNSIHRANLVGAAEQVASLFRLARYEAIKRGQPVRWRAEFGASSEGSAREVFVFVDKDDPPDNTYDPTRDGPKVGSYALPQGVLMSGPGSATDGDASWHKDLTYDGPTTQARATFSPDGSVDVTGSIRLRDVRGNILEVRISPQSTARTAIRKYFGDPSAGDDPTQYFENGEAGNVWQWN